MQDQDRRPILSSGIVRYAIFSDIHGNLQAWNAVRQDMTELQADVLVCLGDVVGYGPLPEQVLTEIRRSTTNFVLGNHDAAAAGLLDSSYFNDHARAVIDWTRDQLSPDSHQFLRNTPLTMQTEDMLFVHAEIEQPARFGYIEDAKDAFENLRHNRHFVTFVGHTHHPTIFDLSSDGSVYPQGDVDYRLDRSHRYIVNVGSVGEPRNPDDIRARYVIYDSDTCELYFRRIEFDPEAYRRDLQSTTLTIQPYFLQVFDHAVAELAAEEHHAMMVDMQTPAEMDYAAKFKVRQPKQLHVPDEVDGAPKPKPKPMPAKQPGKVSRAGVVTILVMTGLTLAVAVLFAVGMSGSRTGPANADDGGSQAENGKRESAAVTEPPRQPQPQPKPPDPKPPDPPPPPTPREFAKLQQLPDGACRWDFGSNQLNGWEPVGPHSFRGGLTGGKGRDEHHETLLMKSPKFVFDGRTLDGERVFVAQMQGGAGNQDDLRAPAEWAEVAGFNGGASSDTGQKGLAFHNVTTENYDAVFFKGGDGNETQTFALSRDELLERGVDPNAIYQLHFFDNDHGYWGWTALKYVHIAARSPTEADELRVAVAADPDYTPPTPEPDPVTVARWRMDQEPGLAVLQDALGAHQLLQHKPGRPIAGLAPTPIPLTHETNQAAMTLGVWAEPKASGKFALSAENSFTLEGWIMIDREQTPVYVAGTQSGQGKGWRLDFKAGANADSPGTMRFVYIGEGEPLTVLNNEIELYDPHPHHFAVVWNRIGGEAPDTGRIRIFYDGEEAAAAELPHARIAKLDAEELAAFRLGSLSNPERVAVDEVRFTNGVLGKREFLSLGARFGAVAFMFDLGSTDEGKVYEGANSPAHFELAIPANHGIWNGHNSGTDSWRQTRWIRQADGENYAIPLKVDLGQSNGGSVDINWNNRAKTEAEWGSAEGVFSPVLMDAERADGGRVLGFRVRGMEPGNYTVYTSPFWGDAPKHDFKFGIGTDGAGDNPDIRNLNDERMQTWTYQKDTVTAEDKTWELDRNYFKRDVRIASIWDYVVVIVDKHSARASLPFVQIVKRNGPSVVPAQMPIAFRFDEQKLDNQPKVEHPGLGAVTRISGNGLKFRAKDDNGRSLLEADAETDGYLSFRFDVTGQRMSLAGFSMEFHGSHDELRRRVTLHDSTGVEIAELVRDHTVPRSITYVGTGTLAGARPLGIPLSAQQSYEVRIALRKKTAGRKWVKLDGIRLDFSGR